MKKIYLSIAKISDTGEYKVLWREDSKSTRPKEEAAYYTPDPVDAVDTMLDMAERTANVGNEPHITKTGVTQSAIDFWMKSSSKEISPEVGKLLR